MDNSEGNQTMQATVTTNTRQFGFNRFGTTVMALGIAAGIAVGAAGGAIIDTLPTGRTSETAIVRPKAHSSVNQGEGMLAGTAGVTAAVRAYTDVRQGDGVLGGNLAVAELPMAHPSLGRGDGIVGGAYIEQNLNLPGSATATGTNWRVIEANNWGEHFNLDRLGATTGLPGADNVRSHDVTAPY